MGRAAMSLGEGAVRFGKQAIDREVGDERLPPFISRHLRIDREVAPERHGPLVSER
jgi:hypothetical protein